MSGKIIFMNVIGTFVFDNQLNILESHHGDYTEGFREKYKKVDEPSAKQFTQILAFFRDPDFFEIFHQANIKITKKQIKESVTEGTLAIQASHAKEETEKAMNLLSKRLREWYALTNPEFERSIEQHIQFAEAILKKTRDQLLREMNISEEVSMGKKLSDEDLKEIQNIAWQITQLYALKQKQELYVDELMKRSFPNMHAVAGPLLAAKILSRAGSIQRLVNMPASTIQILGAEKALFRHMRNKGKNPPPKYGIIYQHDLIQSAKPKHRGKIARILADTFSLAAKLDYFHGKYQGEKLKTKILTKVRDLR